MSGQAGPFSQVPKVIPPLKGSFPLDHDGDCKLSMLNYMVCLNEHKHNNEDCRQMAKKYFECRMQKGLMAKEDWAALGYGDLDDAKSESSKEISSD